MNNHQIEDDKTKCYIAIIQSYYKVCPVENKVIKSRQILYNKNFPLQAYLIGTCFYDDFLSCLMFEDFIKGVSNVPAPWQSGLAPARRAPELPVSGHGVL